MQGGEEEKGSMTLHPDLARLAPVVMGVPLGLLGAWCLVRLLQMLEVFSMPGDMERCEGCGVGVSGDGEPCAVCLAETFEDEA